MHVSWRLLSNGISVPPLFILVARRSRLHPAGVKTFDDAFRLLFTCRIAGTRYTGLSSYASTTIGNA